MPNILQRKNRHRRSKKQNPQVNQPRLDNPILITDVNKTGSVLTLTFDQAVRMQGTPGITTNIAGVTPVSAAQTAPDTVEITFSAAITTAVSLNLPFRDPAIRNETGGFVTSTTFPAT